MSQETETEAASGHSGGGASRWSLRWFAAVLLNWLKKDLFRRTEGGPVGWRKILIAVACVIAGTAISLSRTVGAGSLNTIWIEDAKFLLNQGLNVSFWTALRAPISSYYQEPARIFTEIAIQFPLSWAPGVMAIFAAAQYAMYGLVAYIASGPYLRSPWLRLLIAAPVCAIPLAYTQVNNDLVTVQFFGLLRCLLDGAVDSGHARGQDPFAARHGDRVLDSRPEHRVRPAHHCQADRRPVQERLVPGHPLG